MPIYIYTDYRHTVEVIHGMNEKPLVLCDECGEAMHRVYTAPAVNWNGDSSRHPLHPNVKRFIEGAAERRDKFAEEHERHERTATA